MKEDDSRYIKVCDMCNGNGMINRVVQLGPGMIQQSMSICEKCNGNGKPKGCSNTQSGNPSPQNCLANISWWKSKITYIPYFFESSTIFSNTFI